MTSKIALITAFSASILFSSIPSEARIVNCGVHQHAVVRTIRLSNGARVNRVACLNNSRVIVRRAPHRSWKKSALVIGGASAAGAGVGALVGGGKGAVVGGVAGGAAGSVYEAHKRHHHHRRYRRRL